MWQGGVPSVGLSWYHLACICHACQHKTRITYSSFLYHPCSLWANTLAGLFSLTLMMPRSWHCTFQPGTDQVTLGGNRICSAPILPFLSFFCLGLTPENQQPVLHVQDEPAITLHITVFVSCFLAHLPCQLALSFGLSPKEANAAESESYTIWTEL